DQLAPRNSPKTLFPVSNQASITFAYDYNRDKKVGAADQLIARSSLTNVTNALRLITVPASPLVVAAPLKLAPSGLVASALVEPTAAMRPSPSVLHAEPLSVQLPIGNSRQQAIDNVFASYG